MKKKFFMHAFSLMEMMIVLLIVAIIAAASAPMISKKMMRQTGTGDSPWVFTGIGNSIAYNMDGNDDTVFIGRGGETFGAGGNYFDIRVTRIQTVPLMIHNSPQRNGNGNILSPAIAFADDRNRIMGYLGMTRGTTYFSNLIPLDGGRNDDGAVIVGTNIRANTNGNQGNIFNKIIYGYNIDYSITGDVGSRNHDIIFGSNIGDDGNLPRRLRQIRASSDNAANSNIIIGNNIDGGGNVITNTTAIGDSVVVADLGNVTGGIAIGATAQVRGGINPIAFGNHAIANGDRTIAIGADSQSLAAGSIAIGANALVPPASTGTIAIGTNAQPQNAMNSITIGAHDNNTTGAQAGGAIAIGRNVRASGQDSIAIGGGNTTIASGQDSIAIGRNAQASQLNSVAIGIGAVTDANNQIRLGSASHTVVIPGTLRVDPGRLCKLDGNPIKASDLQQASDIRLKNVGEKLTSGLEDIKKLEFFNYTFKDDKEQKPHVGVMAQDLQKVFPISVTEGSDGYLRIRWDEMFYAALNAIKELDNKITEIKTKVTSYFDRVAKLEAQIDEQQKTIEELQKQNAEFKKRLAKIEKRGIGVKGVNNKIKTPALKSESEAE